MARVIFPIERGPVQCPKCKKYLIPPNMIILEQTQLKTRYRCYYCGHEFEIAGDRPDFYTIV